MSDIKYINTLKNNMINYDHIQQNIYRKMVKETPVNVSVIIPVRSRAYFNEILTSCLNNAMSHFNGYTYSITFVEHSDNKEHEEFCNSVNYIHIPAKGQPFNKCLAMNVGALFSNKADFFLFHDLDIMMRRDFFRNIFMNLKASDNRAVQPFKLRRVLYVNDTVSMAIRTGSIPIDSVVLSQAGITVGTPGAPGGSMFVERNHFFEIGGYDAELFFGYSIEDQFFYDKLIITGGVESCNNPPNEVLHLYHPPLWNSNPHADEHDALYRNFKHSSTEHKMEYMKLKFDKIKQYL